MRLTEREHLALAALMEQMANQRWLTAFEREDYLFKAHRFRILARYAKRAATLSTKSKSATIIRLKTKNRARLSDC